MNVLILEPYLTGSHAEWAMELARRSRHDIRIMGLEGRHWKWRMHGGAVTLAGLYLSEGPAADLILASDMLDLSTFLAATRARTADLKTAVYFHENQLSYPWPGDDPVRPGGRDAHYGFINYTSALAADAVVFNSRYHLESFDAELVPFLMSFPDYRNLDSVEFIRKKCSVLPLGMDLARFDEYKTERAADRPPLILWNHRWEYDKNPEEFFKAVFVLQDEGLEFEVALLGRSYSRVPPVFPEAASRLGARIVRSGFEESFDAYASWLWKADILPVTSSHDFFGASVVQASYCNCYPLLPKRLAYPEHIPADKHDDFLYEGFDDLVARLRERIENIGETRRTVTSGFVERYDWANMIDEYDAFLENVHGDL